MKIFLGFLVLLLLGGGAFYWFQIRQGEIKAECNTWAIGEEKRQINNAFELAKQGKFPTDLREYETLYQQCLREKGI